jgi:hypothetical protein
MNANSQAPQGHVGRAGHVSNYKNIKNKPPYTGIEFNDGKDKEAGMEDIKVATANITVNEVISTEHTEGAANVRPHIKFNDDGDDNMGKDDIKVATTNIPVNEVCYSERAEGARDVRPHPPLLPAYDSGRAFNTTTTTVSSEGEGLRVL